MSERRGVAYPGPLMATNRVRDGLKRVPGLHPAVAASKLAIGRVRGLWGPQGLWGLPPADIVRLTYNVLLRREPDPGALGQYVPALTNGTLSPAELIDGVRTSEEFRVRTPLAAGALLQSLHFSRIEFILGLPRARHIIDLGGSATYSDSGALVLLGYPYDFERLTVVDLPPDDRHELYRSDAYHEVQSERGPVAYEFRSMSDLSFAADSSIDLVYSGQSIEHVTREDAALTLKEVLRVLRPGGFLALDTPNAEVCRLQTPEFIDPDHKYEYTLAELDDLVTGAGLEVLERKGLNLGVRSIEQGLFDAGEFAGRPGVFAEARACYLLAVTARKPLQRP